MGRLSFISSTKKYFPKLRESMNFQIISWWTRKVETSFWKKMNCPNLLTLSNIVSELLKYRRYVLFTQVLLTRHVIKRIYWIKIPSAFAHILVLFLTERLSHWMYSIITHWDKWKLLFSLWWAVCAPIGDDGPSFTETPSKYIQSSKQERWVSTNQHRAG